MKVTKRQLEIFNLIKQCEEKIGHELYLIYNQFTKNTDIANIDFNSNNGNRIKYDSIGSFKVIQNTLYSMLDNNLLETKEINGMKFTTTVKQ